jgi:hypothetical protein
MAQRIGRLESSRVDSANTGNRGCDEWKLLLLLLLL